MEATSDIVIPETILEKGREKKGHKGYTEWARNAASVLDITVETLETVMEAYSRRVEKAAEREKRDEDISNLAERFGDYATPKRLQALLDEGKRIEGAYGITVMFLWDTDGNVSVRTQGTRKDGNGGSSGEVSPKSTISSWNAYKMGQRHGDTFKVTKKGPRSYLNEKGEEFSNLTGYIRENYPNSHAASVLARYGQL